ncbi:cytidine deaminase [Leeuwenhoekiella aestuarii]|uniref:Cytidine deaminase n=1 Tax=Leeuwenhoekiella aestuarii TaxID=2249426 RepID=A0A4Q0NS39_9FLAO|nr:cytidine deaminase [Leeuwenhoekiella aestuarii]RXG12663.1 cytidine deaminase [Leeuwenhoekiella aestuarii]RXG14610.1 cytidine deaminase [Leeuwenhoekiella aestuarii]
MKKIRIESELEAYDDLKELPKDIQDLMRAAFEARDAAYAPYSKFHVGAAIQLENGIVVKGSNQENAAYPSGLCAERTAIYYAGANHADQKINTIAISAKAQNKETLTPIPPCGACRQAIAEYEVKQDQPIVIYFMGERGAVFKSDSLRNLLPFIFTQEYL